MDRAIAGMSANVDACFQKEMADHAWMRNVPRGVVTGVMSEDEKQQLRDAGRGPFGAVMSALTLPHFHYTGESEILMSIDVDMDAELLIVGQPENGAYEWVIVNHGVVEKHSDCGYGMRSIALRDGLIAFHGMAPLYEATADLAEALQALLYACDSPELIIKARAALKKAGLEP